MRMRGVQPAFWDSPVLGGLSWDARLAYVGMWSYVRDEGVGIDSVGLIAGALFAFDVETDYTSTAQRISAALDELCGAEMLTRFEVNGIKYIEVANWADWQKPDHPGKVRFPTSASVQPLSRESSRESSRKSSRSDVEVDVDVELEVDAESEGDARGANSPSRCETLEASRKRSADTERTPFTPCRLCNGEGWQLDGEGKPVDPARKCPRRGQTSLEDNQVLDAEVVQDSFADIWGSAK
jgi:hypothetical protein